jgi:hypothetical protein
MTSPFAKAAPLLVAGQFVVLPIAPGEKFPGAFKCGEWVPMFDWHARFVKSRKVRANGAAEIQVWSDWPNAGIGVLLGDGLLGVDIDTDDAAIWRVLAKVLPPSTARKRGNKGQTLFYLVDDDVPNAAINGTDGKRIVDVLYDGRQTVLPSTPHASTGKPYEYIGSETLENTPKHKLAKAPSNIVDFLRDALAPIGATVAITSSLNMKPSDGSPGEHPYQFRNREALMYPDKWVPALRLSRCERTRDGYKAVADWRPSNTGRDLKVRDLNLSISRKGITDFGDGWKGYSPIDLVAAKLNLTAEDAFVWLCKQLDK